MIASLALLVLSPQHSSFSLYVTNDVRHVSWDAKGRKTDKYVIPSETVKEIAAMGRALAKGLHGEIGKDTDPNTRMLVLICPETSSRRPNFFFKLGDQDFQGGVLGTEIEHPRQWIEMLGLPKGKFEKFVPVAVGIAEGKWKPIGSFSIASKKKTGIHFSPKLVPPIYFSAKPAPTAKKSVVDAWVPKSATGNDWRIAAYNRAGVELDNGGSQTRRPGGKIHVQQWFSCRQSEIARVELQTRPIRWTSMGEVPLDPK